MRHKDTGEFLDLCSLCRKSVMSMASFEVTDRPDLLVEFYIDLEDSGGFGDTDGEHLYNNYRDAPEH